MKRQLFSESSIDNQKVYPVEDASIEKLVEIQAIALVNTYHTTCFDIKQLQEVLGVGETNAYRLVKSGKLVFDSLFINSTAQSQPYFRIAPLSTKKRAAGKF